MPIHIVETKRLYRQISDQLRALIIAGEFPVGSRLPAERDLAVQLGVSRPSLREALIALEVEGYITVHMGSGIYVCELPARNQKGFDLSSEEGPLELIRARALLEGEVAAAAAKHGSKEEFDAIEEAIDIMEVEAAAGIKPIDADRLFHLRVAEASGNSVLVGVVQRLFDSRLGTLFDQLHSHFDTPDVWQQAIAEHRAVLTALRAKSAAKARDAMRAHMDIAHKRLTSSLTRSPKKVAAAKPAAVKPVAVKPAAIRPAATRSSAIKPAIGKPVASKPAATKSIATKSIATKSTATKSVQGKPATSKQMVIKPAAIKPAARRKTTPSA
jgi:DNA-binding FadR family transcriptional regulator